MDFSRGKTTLQGSFLISVEGIDEVSKVECCFSNEINSEALNVYFLSLITILFTKRNNLRFTAGYVYFSFSTNVNRKAIYYIKVLRTNTSSYSSHEFAS